MANLKKVFFALTFTALVACGVTTAPPVGPKIVLRQGDVMPPVGLVTLVDGSIVNLAATTGAHQITIFASQTCSVCRAEARLLVSDRQRRGPARNVRIFTVIVGAILQDARDWSADLNVNWQVGINSDDEIFRQYCTEHKTPCSFVTNATTHTTTKLLGAHSIDELEQITGPWLF